jgi:hypothetical protein
VAGCGAVRPLRRSGSAKQAADKQAAEKEMQYAEQQAAEAAEKQAQPTGSPAQGDSEGTQNLRTL